MSSHCSVHAVSVLVLVAVHAVGRRHQPPLTDQGRPAEGRELGGCHQELAGRPTVDDPEGVGEAPAGVGEAPAGVGEAPAGARPPAGEDGVVGGQLGTVVTSAHDPLSRRTQ